MKSSSILLLFLVALLAEPLAAAPVVRPGMIMRPSVMHLRSAHPSVAASAQRNNQAQRSTRFGGAGYAYGGPYLDGTYVTSPAPVLHESEEPAVIYAAPAVAAACIRPRLIELTKRPPTKLPKVFYGSPLNCSPSGA